MAGAVVQNASGQYLLYAIGGSNDDKPALKRVEAYNVAIDKWFSKADLPLYRSEASAATLGGKIYVVGGRNLNQNPTRTLFVYDPAVNAWAQKARLPVTSTGFSTGVIGGKLYVLTPWSGSGDRLYRYNPTTNAWKRLPDSPHLHWEGIGGVINGKFYVAWGISDAVDVFDPVANRWTTASPETCPFNSPDDCSIHRAGGTVFRNQLWVIGGKKDDETSSLPQAYDPITNSWTRKALMHYERERRPVVGTVKNAAGQSRIVVVGGFSGGTPDGLLSATEMYAP